MTIKTQVFRTDSHNIQEILGTCGKIIKQGGTVAFPTETVYGVGADALNSEAVRKIFIAKGRPADNPLIVHISTEAQLREIAQDIPEKAFILMNAFWPGPLTLILNKKAFVPEITTCGLDTIAVRMPNNPLALGLIEESGTPIAAPSANLSGKPSPTTAEHVIADLNGKIDAIIDGGPAIIGVESTVLDLTSEIPELLRPGGISVEEIRKHVGEVLVYDSLKGDVVKSPGMKYTHYSPETSMVLVLGNNSSVLDKISELVSEYQLAGKRVGLLVTRETAREVSSDHLFILGSRDDVSEIARNLFAGLRHLDKQNIDIIIADGGLKDEGMGAAVINRLKKAADELVVT
jgi:L-threonylcarbamoyladenylate synthase